MKQPVHVYCDKEGIFGFVSEIPKESKLSFVTREPSFKTAKALNQCIKNQSLEKIKSESIRFKDQRLIASEIICYINDSENRTAGELFVMGSFKRDTFYSIELEGYEVGFEDEIDPYVDPYGSWTNKVAILKPVASQKDSPSKEELPPPSIKVMGQGYHIDKFKSSKEQELQKEYSKMENEIRILLQAQGTQKVYCQELEDKNDELQKEIEQLRHERDKFEAASIQYHDNWSTAIAKVSELIQSNKELLEALKVAFPYMSVYENPSDHESIKSLIQKHSNTSTVNEKEEQIPDIAEKAFLAGRSKTSWEQFVKDHTNTKIL